MTVTTYDNVSNCNASMIRIGGEQIDSIVEPTTDLEAQCAVLYPLLVDALLGEHDWNWARQEMQLAADLDVTPLKKWDKAFRLPADMIAGPFAVFGDGREIGTHAYEIFGDHLYCDFSVVIVNYRRRKPEANWPPYFTRLVVTAFASQMAIPVRENLVLSEKLDIEAFGLPQEGRRGGLMGRAMTLDAQSKPIKSIFANGDPLTSTRR